MVHPRRRFIQAGIATAIGGMGSTACSIFTDPVYSEAPSPGAKPATAPTTKPASVASVTTPITPVSGPPSSTAVDPAKPPGLAPVQPAARDSRLSPVTPFIVGDQRFARNQFQQALDALRDGDTLLIQGGAAYNVTGVLRAANATVKAVGGKAVLTGLNVMNFPAQGKALIVQQGASTTYEDIIF
jgi:hypothetical protein